MTSFESVTYAFSRSPCSPRFTSDEPEGIKIAAPAQFSFSAQPSQENPDELPLCMTMKFGALYLRRFDNVFRAVKLIITDDERKEVLSGGVWEDRPSVRRPANKVTHEELVARTYYEYGTVNLLDYFALPRRSATYNVYAVLEEHKSNVATLRVSAP